MMVTRGGPVKRKVVGIDLFCGAGGLTRGLKDAGIAIVAGIDVDPACEFPFTSNNRGARFIQADVNKVDGQELSRLYPSDCVRLLAGCAPCQPFSPLRRGTNNSRDSEWSLLDAFGRLTEELQPELVTMENVPDLANKTVFKRFIKTLKLLGYSTAWGSVYCPRYGVPQHRRRLVLLASRLGAVRLPKGELSPAEYRTVRDTIFSLPAVAAGCADPIDRIHLARGVSTLNLKRLQLSKPGGTWRDWPRRLRAACHQKTSGASYQNVYARMKWDEPAPTITTLAYSFGSGRFGHPEQDRSITLREAALLQSFPPHYRFVRRSEAVYLERVGRLIGNAVPPILAKAIGKELIRAAHAGVTRS
jgi:DNA (cytosine-5)-methyltransferase 1